MNIKSLSELKYNQDNKMYNLYSPDMYYPSLSLMSYTVQKEEEMRIDLVMMSIYDDKYTLEDIDVILFINGIDNALNINIGDVIYYPDKSRLSYFRYYIETNEINIAEKLSTPNKSTVKDPNRKKFIENGYSLPPVVLKEPKVPVRIEGDSIVMGGLN